MTRHASGALDSFTGRQRRAIELEGLHAHGQHEEATIELLRRPEADDLARLIEQHEIGYRIAGAVFGEQSCGVEHRERRDRASGADAIDRPDAAERRTVE